MINHSNQSAIRDTIPLLSRIFILSKIGLQVVKFFKTTTFMRRLRPRVRGEKWPGPPSCPDTCCPSLRKGQRMETDRSQRPESGERGRGARWLSNLYIFTASSSGQSHSTFQILGSDTSHKPPENER